MSACRAKDICMTSRPVVDVVLHESSPSRHGEELAHVDGVPGVTGPPISARRRGSRSSLLSRLAGDHDCSIDWAWTACQRCSASFFAVWVARRSARGAWYARERPPRWTTRGVVSAIGPSGRRPPRAIGPVHAWRQSFWPLSWPVQPGAARQAIRSLTPRRGRNSGGVGSAGFSCDQWPAPSITVAPGSRHHLARPRWGPLWGVDRVERAGDEGDGMCRTTAGCPFERSQWRPSCGRS